MRGERGGTGGTGRQILFCSLSPKGADRKGVVGIVRVCVCVVVTGPMDDWGAHSSTFSCPSSWALFSHPFPGGQTSLSSSSSSSLTSS